MIVCVQQKRRWNIFLFQKYQRESTKVKRVHFTTPLSEFRAKPLQPNALNHSESCRIDPPARTSCPCSRRSSLSAWRPAGTCWSAWPGCCRTGSRCWSTFRCLQNSEFERKKRSKKEISGSGFCEISVRRSLTNSKWWSPVPVEG